MVTSRRSREDLDFGLASSAYAQADRSARKVWCRRKGGNRCSRQKPAEGFPRGRSRRPKPSQQAASESCVVSIGASRATKRRQRAREPRYRAPKSEILAGAIHVGQGRQRLSGGSTDRTVKARGGRPDRSPRTRRPSRMGPPETLGAPVASVTKAGGRPPKRPGLSAGAIRPLIGANKWMGAVPQSERRAKRRGKGHRESERATVPRKRGNGPEGPREGKGTPGYGTIGGKDGEESEP